MKRQELLVFQQYIDGTEWPEHSPETRFKPLILRITYLTRGACCPDSHRTTVIRLRLIVRLVSVHLQARWATLGVPQEAAMAASGHKSLAMHYRYANLQEADIKKAFGVLTRFEQKTDLDEARSVSY